MGLDQVIPRSVERSTAMKLWFEGWTPEPVPRKVTSTRVPSGSMTIWLPIVKSLGLPWSMLRAGSQVCPPSVLRENMGTPRNA